MNHSLPYHRKKSRSRSKNKRFSWRQRLAALGVSMLVVGVAGVALFSVIVPDAPRTLWLNLTHWAGFEVRAVYVIGRQKTSRDDILAVIDVKIGEPLFRVEPEAMRQAVETIGAVKAARVERRLDGSILLHLEERSPHALWRQSDQDYLIDRDGVVFGVIDWTTASIDARLLILIGPQAPQQAGDLFNALNTVPEVGMMTAKAVNHHGRRWDLYLRNGTILHLPRTDVAQYLRHIQAIDDHYGLLQRNIGLIDLRQPDRIRIMKGIANQQTDRVEPDAVLIDPHAVSRTQSSADHTQSDHAETRT